MPFTATVCSELLLICSLYIVILIEGMIMKQIRFVVWLWKPWLFASQTNFDSSTYVTVQNPQVQVLQSCSKHLNPRVTRIDELPLASWSSSRPSLRSHLLYVPRSSGRPDQMWSALVASSVGRGLRSHVSAVQERSNLRSLRHSAGLTRHLVREW